ncbi:hypothetical protein DESC_720232 [Desulfosarcina cetonica]|nr:hypothetical protein DESC_720232 [Desulfosarcina cetonica]
MNKYYINFNIFKSSIKSVTVLQEYLTIADIRFMVHPSVLPGEKRRSA